MKSITQCRVVYRSHHRSPELRVIPDASHPNYSSSVVHELQVLLKQQYKAQPKTSQYGSARHTKTPAEVRVVLQHLIDTRIINAIREGRWTSPQNSLYSRAIAYSSAVSPHARVPAVSILSTYKREYASTEAVIALSRALSDSHHPKYINISVGGVVTLHHHPIDATPWKNRLTYYARISKLVDQHDILLSAVLRPTKIHGES